MMSMHRMPFGAEVRATGGVRFRLWAPACETVELELVGAEGAVRASLPMQHREGWHECVVIDAGAGTLYRYRVAPQLAVPDPASRSNPQDVHGPSAVVDPLAYTWHDASWRGLAWHRAALYELHVGTFTSEGRLDSARARLPDLKALGINTVSLMPLAEFPGQRSWGYDGVLPFAPDATYGTPEDLKQFIDAAHALGMMVLLDVVYNHFGPDGNYLHAYCPQFFNTHSQTPWGPAINYDGPDNATVRRFFIDNALFWVNEYHFDGLRLDAVHAIRDTSEQHIVADIADALQRGPGREREVHLVLENDANAAHWLERDASGRPLLASAQWNDDLHHAAHVLATRETSGYYSDYAEDPAALFGRALAEGFVYQGQPSALRGGAAHGEPSAALPSHAFVAFLQNHDQIGNRAFGERLEAIADAGRVDALMACVLLSPHVPMLFMGEEFRASTPFLYFCNFSEPLASAVTKGRRSEFAEFHGDNARAAIPDPNAPATFESSKLRWSERDLEPGSGRLALVKNLLALRGNLLVPLMPAQTRGGTLQSGPGWFVVDWLFAPDWHWTLRANFGSAPVSLPVSALERTVYQAGVAGSGPSHVHLQGNGVHVSVWQSTAA